MTELPVSHVLPDSGTQSFHTPSSLVAIWANNPQLNLNAPAVSWPRYGGVALLFTAVATIACLIPSLCAARIDPLLALRAE